MERMNAHSAAVDRNRSSFVLLDASSDGVTSEVLIDVPVSFSCFRASLYSRSVSKLDNRQMEGGLVLSNLGDGLGVDGGVDGMSTTEVFCVVSMSVEDVFVSQM
jgi:hypothetical protein